MALGLLWTSICFALFATLLVVDRMGLLSRKNKFPVKGRTVLLTGGSQGMGRSAGRLLAQQGANVIIVARTVRKLEVAVNYIAEAAADPSTQRFHFIPGDLSQPLAFPAILADATKWNNGSPPDIIWCCHGSAHPSLLTETPLDTFKDQVETNYFSNLYVAHAAVKGWLQPSSLLSASKTESAPEPRHIIFTSSFLAFLPILGYSPYSPAKAALRNLADTLAMETKLYESTHVPIRVHTIFPATIFTEGFENENKTKPDVTKKLEEDDGGQTPEEVARMAMKGLENGEEMITTTLMTRFAMSGMMGGSMRSGWVVLDVLLGMVSAIAMPFIRMWLHGEVKKWGAANGGSGAKKVS